MELFYRQYGNGTPLIILHGLLGSLDNWHTLARKFGDHFTVFAIDQRNHGQSPHTEEFNYEVLSRDILEFIQQHRLSAVSLIGHSMGGKAAMTFALSYPQLVEKLIVVDIAPKHYAPHHHNIFTALKKIDLVHAHDRQEIDTLLSADIPSFDTRQFLLKNLKRSESGGFTWKMNLDAIIRSYDEMNKPIRSEKPFEKPILFIRGSRSDYIRNDDLPKIQELFPQARFVDIDAGHWVHAEAPEEFTKILLDFLMENL